jgi:phospholipid/cholesterol/gamma-HCH transport system substrate-binding protein
MHVERDAKYAAVAVFALLAVAAAFAFVWWYSGQGDRRVYERYEIYFNGSVSGLARGSPVRYLGVDVGRVETLAVDRANPGRVKVLVSVDDTTPVSSATRARLGLLGLTGLLFIDLQKDPAADATQALATGARYPVIVSRRGDIEAFLARLPDLVGQAGAVMTRVERMLSDDNLHAVTASLENLDRASRELPAITADTAALTADLRRTAAEVAALSQRMNGLVADSQPDVEASLAGLRTAAERLGRTSASLERIVAGNEASLDRLAGSGTQELQQLVIDLRDASGELRSLARGLRDNPASLLREKKEGGVEIRP